MVWTPARFFRPGPSGGVECRLCPERCLLRDGALGRCAVRRHAPGPDGGGMETATAATSVAHRDAVERKPLYHYRPGAAVLTLSSPGCTFRCSYCVNHVVSQFGRDPAVGWSARAVDPAEVVAAAVAQDAHVALSYTEPSLAAELTLALAAAGRPVGVDVVWKSNGYLTPEAAVELAPALAAVNVDLKTVDPSGHRRLTGAPVEPVLETIALLRAEAVWVEVSTPLIPGLSDTPERLRDVAERLATVDPAMPWHLLRFTPAYRYGRFDPTPPEALSAGREVGRTAGLSHVYVERALGDAGRTTWCGSCGAVLVRRAVWGLVENRLAGGRCPDCEHPLPGRWQA